MVFLKFEWNKNIQLVDILSLGMTNGTENSRNFQISGKKDNRLSIYLILHWKFRLNSPVVILNGRWKQWSFHGLDKKDTRRPREQICLPVDKCMLAAVPPVPDNFCYPVCCSNVQCVNGVLAAHLSKSQKRADLKENLSSKRDTASIESEVHWQDRYASLLCFYEGIGTLGMISTDLFRFVLRAWLKYCSAFRYT